MTFPKNIKTPEEYARYIYEHSGNYCSELEPEDIAQAIREYHAAASQRQVGLTAEEARIVLGWNRVAENEGLSGGGDLQTEAALITRLTGWLESQGAE